jgi:hypothetical protein
MENAGCSRGAHSQILLIVLFAVPLAILLGKLPGAPTAAAFTRLFTLAHLPARLHAHLQYLVFVPLSAIVVVLFRVTLGIPVFGLFRPILLGIAFRITGLGLGVVFLAAVMAVIVLIRPVLRVARLHSYARQSVTLSVVVLLMLATVAGAAETHMSALLRVARFPVISLCLISEHFAKALDEKGLRNAAWRGSMTVAAGISICLIAEIPGLMRLLLRFPELLMAQIGCVVAVGEFLNLRLAQRRFSTPKTSPPALRAAPSASTLQTLVSEVAE